MKTPINNINSTIIVPNRIADTPENALKEHPQTDRAPRAHIVNRRAERWARRSTH